jgi:hypothetical protein
VSAAERQRQSRARRRSEAQDSAPLIFRVDDWRELVDPVSLPMQAGCTNGELAALVLKELVDNALDQGGASLDHRDGCWIVADRGAGIDPDRVPLIFAVDRPQESTKRIRLPARGSLGHGTRIIAGFAACYGLAVAVTSRGVRQELRISRETGRTHVAARAPVPMAPGTVVEIEARGLAGGLSPALFPDVDHLARAALAVIEGQDRRTYQGPSSPWWYSVSDLRFLHASAPPGTTLGEIVTALGLPIPRGLPGADRTESDLGDADAGAALDLLRRRHRPVAPREVGRLGRDAFGADGYAIAFGTRTQGGAQIPYVAEAWAWCPARLRNRVEIAADPVSYINGTPTLRGIGLSGGNRAVHVSGAGLGQGHYGSRIEIGNGRYFVDVAVTTPHMPIATKGKHPNMNAMRGAVMEAVQKAMREARRYAPDDAEEQASLADGKRATAENREKARQRRDAEARARAERQAERDAERRDWRDLGGPRILLRMIEAAAEEAGIPPDELGVLSPGSDPFLIDTPRNHRIGRWFGEQWKAHAGEARMHLRAFHYRMPVGTPRPTGKPYANRRECWQWLLKASVIARWLGYVAFDRIVDERNDTPVWRSGLSRAPESIGGAAIHGGEMLVLPPTDDLLPRIRISGEPGIRQPVHIAFVGEKTSLRPKLAPIAEDIGADLLLPAGEPSLTMISELVDRAIADGRPLVVIVLTDCDPTGFGIPASVGRKVQGLLALRGSDLHARVIHAGLTPEQARRLDLPDAILGPKEKRSAKWLAQHGIGQVEIDALVALRPEEFQRIVETTLAPFYDVSLRERAEAAWSEWRAEAQAAADGAFNADARLPDVLAEMERSRAAAIEATEAINAAIRQGVLIAADVLAGLELPPQPAPLEPVMLGAEAVAVLLDTADDFAMNTRRMREAKLRDAPCHDPDGDEGMPPDSEDD